MRRAAAALALLTLAACGEGGDPVQMALRDAAAARQAAALEETTEAAAPAADDDAAWIAGTIGEHRAAITEATNLLAESKDPEIRRLAQAEIESRTARMADLQGWKPAS